MKIVKKMNKKIDKECIYGLDGKVLSEVSLTTGNTFELSCSKDEFDKIIIAESSTGYIWGEIKVVKGVKQTLNIHKVRNLDSDSSTAYLYIRRISIEGSILKMEYGVRKTLASSYSSDTTNVQAPNLVLGYR